MSVVSLYGGPVGERERNEACIQTLRRYLEKAEAGEVVGVVVVGLYYDAAADYGLGGVIGGYAILGALETAKHDIIAGDGK